MTPEQASEETRKVCDLAPVIPVDVEAAARALGLTA